MVGIGFAVPASAAHAAAFDVPYPPTPAGVRLAVTGTQEVEMRFGPQAAKVWRSVAGRRAQMACVHLTPRNGDFDPSAYSALDGRTPRRGRVARFGSESAADLCALATRGRPSFDGCLRMLPNDTWCVRVAAPLTDAGRAYLDAFARTAELATMITAIESGGGPEGLSAAALDRSVDAPVVALAGADAAPPAGRIGYFAQGTTTVVATLLADGRRRFTRQDADVYTSNDPRLPGNLEKLSFFSFRGSF